MMTMWICQRGVRLVVKITRKPWTNEEDLFLAENYEDMTNDELAEKLNRTNGAVRNRMDVLFLERSEAVYAYYKGDEYQRSGTAKELAEHYGVKKETIYYYTPEAYARKASKNGYGRIRVVKT